MKIPQSISEFEQNYYYKTELVKLCRQLGLPTVGTKAELNSYIEKYLKGVPTSQIKPRRQRRRHRPLTYHEISVATKLVGSGFCFNSDARRWFADYFGVAKFSFSKQMAVIKRRAEAKHDTVITVGDLIRQTQGRGQCETDSSAEEGTYQWNHFVQAFFKDPATAQYAQRLKVAAILWGLVRATAASKSYSHGLLKKYDRQIQAYKKL